MDLTSTGPAGVFRDAELPWVEVALEPWNITPLLAELPRLGASPRVRRARVTRHKPHRRCAIEYEVATRADGRTEIVTVIGRIRARHDGVDDFARADALWSGAFGEASEDGISVPEPLGALPSLHMWLQRKVRGRGAGDLVMGRAVPDLPERIAEAAHKIHTNCVGTRRRHSVGDEMSALCRYLGEAGTLQPGWRARINRVLDGCAQIASGIASVIPTAIHGDFYHDQVIVSDRRTYVVDFDLYSIGDPALDVGNFVAHLTELALRTAGDPLFLVEHEHRLVARFLQLAGASRRDAVRAYTMLALARHIYLSVTRPGRSATAEAVLDLCERRLDLDARHRIGIAATSSGDRRIV